MNKLLLWTWMGTVALGMFQMGYCMTMFASFLGVLHSQFKGIDGKGNPVINNEDDFNAVVTTAVPLGAALGSFTGSFLASLGRRNAILILNIAICAGSGISMFFNFFALIIGRLIVGYAIGVFTIITPLFISETSPTELSGPLGSLNQFMCTVGIMVGYAFGFLAPLRYLKGTDKEINEEIYTTQSWRIIFAFPAIMATFQSILILVFFRYDTPKYYLQRGKEHMARKVESLIYGEGGAPVDTDEINRTPSDPKDSIVPFRELLTPRYKKAFIVGLLLAMFQQLTGINVVIFYSNTVFTKGRTEGFDADSAARIGTVVVGVVNWAATMSAIPPLSKIGRRTIMLIGHTMMGISLVLLGVWAILELSTLTIIFTLVFVAFFEIGIGSVLWLYLAEITTEIGVSMASVIVWTLTIIVALFTPRMFNLLTPTGMYFLFAGIDILGLAFIFIFVKETKGVKKSDLKYLYCSDSIQKERSSQFDSSKSFEED